MFLWGFLSIGLAVKNIIINKLYLEISCSLTSFYNFGLEINHVRCSDEFLRQQIV